MAWFEDGGKSVDFEGADGGRLLSREKSRTNYGKVGKLLRRLVVGG